jgi:glycosyltransferase involved in cell wall biosynthesis
MSEIAVIVPCLGRPKASAALVESLREASSEPHRVVFVCSPQDAEKIAACRATGAEVLVAPFAPGPGDFARKTNLAFWHTDEPFVFCAADDLRFHPGWDEAVLRAAREHDACVVGTDDLGNPAVRRGAHSTHSLVRRSYALDPGATGDGRWPIYAECYDHQAVDNELVEVACARGCFVFAFDAVVEHLHPYWRKGEMDSTYEKALANGRADLRLLAQRRKLWTRSRAAV